VSHLQWTLYCSTLSFGVRKKTDLPLGVGSPLSLFEPILFSGLSCSSSIKELALQSVFSSSYSSSSSSSSAGVSTESRGYGVGVGVWKEVVVTSFFGVTRDEASFS
jgi:hypothetical protein